MKNPKKLRIKTLKCKWCDKDIVLLHACFQLLTDCVEKEKLINGIIDWNWDENHKKVKMEIEELYTWWKYRIKLDKKGKINPILNHDQYETDNEMLIRLIKIREYLWT
jgi:hypothetical protein